MHERGSVRMEHEAARCRAPIELVAHDRVSRMGEVHANLVSTAGEEPAGHERAAARTRQADDARVRRFARPAHTHAPCVVAVTSDGLTQVSNVPSHGPLHHGEVALVHGMARDQL